MSDSSTENIENRLKLSRKAFQEKVETIVRKDGSYLDAISTICESNGIEVDAVSFYITGTLKERVTLEAKLKFLLKNDLCQDRTIELPL